MSKHNREPKIVDKELKNNLCTYKLFYIAENIILYSKYKTSKENISQTTLKRFWKQKIKHNKNNIDDE